jgi:hypothetical protein
MKIDMFVWTLAHRSILTGENLRRRGWEGPSRCPLCIQEEETSDHLLLKCPFAKEVWNLALGLKPGTFDLPQETNALLRNWSSLCPFQVKKKSQLNILWRTLPKFILWKIWLERNNRLFREITSNPAQVASKIKALFGESAPYFSKVKNSRGLEVEEEQWIKSFNLKEQPEKTSIETRHEKWEIRLKEEEFGEWKRQRSKHLLFFDGASKGNPGRQEEEGSSWTQTKS